MWGRIIGPNPEAQRYKGWETNNVEAGQQKNKDTEES